MFSGEMDEKLWFCTNNTKDVYEVCPKRAIEKRG